jgi:GDPmannose 4,6-dehydratase
MRALITGITGQAGSYLAEQLTAAGHRVFGLLHGQRNAKRAWLEALVPDAELVEGDLLDQSSLQRAVVAAEPDVVFNLGALTFVGMSWHQPTLMTEVTGLGCLRMLEAIRAVDSNIRFVQASTSEMFGNSPAPQSETTPFAPRSPYGVAKLFAHHTTVNYRESYGMHASTAIMFNAESPRRGEEFVTRKVTTAAARIASGEQAELRLGNLAAKRDWGWIPDVVRAWPLIAAQDQPGDYVLATGESHSVAELCDAAFTEVGLDWRDFVRVDETLFRPADVNHLRGDPSKARRVLGWEPTTRFAEIVQRMVTAETLEVAA